MKYFSSVTLILAVMVGTAQADIATTFTQVTANSGHGDFSTNLGDLVDGNSAWAIMVETGPNAKWLGTLLEVELTDGALYYHDFGNVDLSPPNPALLVAFPELRYTTQVLGPGNVKPGSVPDPIFPGDKNKTAEAQHLITGWFEGDPGRAGAVPGTHMIGLLTLSGDAQGVLRGISTDEDSAGGGIEFQVPIIDGQIPEPSTFVLSALGLMGLGFVRMRRRRRA